MSSHRASFFRPTQDRKFSGAMHPKANFRNPTDLHPQPWVTGGLVNDQQDNDTTGGVHRGGVHRGGVHRGGALAGQGMVSPHTYSTRRAKPVRVYDGQLSPRFYRDDEKDEDERLIEFFRVGLKTVKFGPVQQGRTYHFDILVQNETLVKQRAYASLVSVDAEHDCRISFDPPVAVVAPGMVGRITVGLEVPRGGECGILWDQIEVSSEAFVYR